MRIFAGDKVSGESLQPAGKSDTLALTHGGRRRRARVRSASSASARGNWKTEELGVCRSVPPSESVCGC